MMHPISSSSTLRQTKNKRKKRTLSPFPWDSNNNNNNNNKFDGLMMMLFYALAVSLVIQFVCFLISARIMGDSLLLLHTPPPISSTEHWRTVAYAITITECHQEDEHHPTSNTMIIDAAAVLRHSIQLAYGQEQDQQQQQDEGGQRRTKKSKYNAHTIAFVYNDTNHVSKQCIEDLERVGYEVRMKDLPFDVEQIRGEYKDYVDQGCCGRAEWLKLYVYTLMEYRVAIHLDVDALVLQPMDELIDGILLRDDSHILHSMWPKPAPTTISHTNDPQPRTQQQQQQQGYHHSNVSSATAPIIPSRPPITVDAFYTRDYNMVAPGMRKVHQIGLQGGFLVVRPNMSVFLQFLELIIEGNFTIREGWGGGALQYGRYYGGATIQGLGAMMYNHVRPHTAVEVNRCYYNNMADHPRAKKSGKCRTLEQDCQDCRTTPLREVRSIHYTICMKPWDCIRDQAWVNDGGGGGGPAGTNDEDIDIYVNQCRQFHHAWFRVRHSLLQQQPMWKPSSSSSSLSLSLQEEDNAYWKQLLMMDAATAAASRSSLDADRLIRNMTWSSLGACRPPRRKNGRWKYQKLNLPPRTTTATITS